MNDQAFKLRQLASRDGLSEAPQVASLDAPRSGLRTIAVTSGKGGVGKTSFTINLGIALAELGKRVVILDADLGMANVNVALGLSVKHNLFDVLLGRKEIEEVLVEGPGGVWIIPGGSGIAELANIDERQRERLLASLQRLESRADVLLIDTAAGLSQNVLAFALAADTVLVITVPEPPAIADAYGIIKAMLKESPETDVQLVVNRALRGFEGKAVHDKLSLVVRRFLKASIGRLGTVSEDMSVAEAVRMQRPLLVAYPNAPAARDIRALAPRLFEDLQGQRKGIAGFFGSLSRWFR